MNNIILSVCMLLSILPTAIMPKDLDAQKDREIQFSADDIALIQYLKHHRKKSYILNKEADLLILQCLAKSKSSTKDNLNSLKTMIKNGTVQEADWLDDYGNNCRAMLDFLQFKYNNHYQ